MTAKHGVYVAVVGLVVAGVVAQRSAAQAGRVNVIKADFVRTQLKKATDQTPRVIEAGRYLITGDGRHRIDRNGEAEIVRFTERRKIALNLKTKEAFITSLAGGALAMPGAAGAMPGGPPTSMRKDAEHMMSLGTKVVGAVQLEGTSYTVVFGSERQGPVQHNVELWAYRPSNPRLLPIILEERFEDHLEITERRLTTVTMENVAAALFEVPAGFTVTDLLRRR